MEAGELSERAKRTNRPKKSLLSGSKIANVKGAVYMTATISLANFCNAGIILTVVKELSFPMS